MNGSQLAAVRGVRHCQHAREPRAGDAPLRREYEIGYPRAWGGDLVARLQAAGATRDIEPDRRPWGATLLMFLLPVVLVVGFAWLVIRRSSAGGRATTFGRSPAKQLAFDASKITFRGEFTALLAGRSESEGYTDAAVIPFRRRPRVIPEIVSAGGDDREGRHL